MIPEGQDVLMPNETELFGDRVVAITGADSGIGPAAVV